ncbi:MAG: hypothetical protein KKC51_04140 [Verrucomicrobia bacterium]|nr:hypothetical protein [Verrucomicrobiota bacterium]
MSNSLIWAEPAHAIVYAENHDTYCPDKISEPEITRRGIIRQKELAYAFVLFSPGLPSVYWLDYYDTPYHDGRTTGITNGYFGAPLKPTIDRLIWIRTNFLAESISCISTNPTTKADLFIAKRGGAGNKPGAILVLNDHETLSYSNWVWTGWTNAILRDWCPTSSYATVQTDTNGLAWLGATSRSFRIYAPTNWP